MKHAALMLCTFIIWFDMKRKAAQIALRRLNNLPEDVSGSETDEVLVSVENTRTWTLISNLYDALRIFRLMKKERLTTTYN